MKICTGSRPDQCRQVYCCNWPKLLATVGVLFVGLGAIGVLVPGLPTTVFLILASWCFARSCPWLEERLIQVPLFRPFSGYLKPGARMPRRAVATTLLIMWMAIITSVIVLSAGHESHFLSASVLGLGLVGTWFVVRMRETGFRA